MQKIDNFFDAGGLLDSSLTDFEYREGQIEMAQTVNKAYEENSVAIIEAGTGIGKSFAYLLPALLRIEEDSQDKTVIATATKNLQKQLYEKDIPQLFKALGKEWKVAILYGRQNYICKRKLHDKINTIEFNENEEFKLLFAFSQTSKTGLFNEYQDFLSSESRQAVCSDSETCTNYNCPFVGECFYYKAKKLAKEASLLITNHHLVFTDCAYRKDNNVDFSKEAILPPYLRLVIDEAHNIEQNATDLFTSIYSSFELSKQLIKLTKKREKGKNILEVFAFFSKKPNLIESIMDLQDSANKETDTLNQYLSSFLQNRKTNNFRIKQPEDSVYNDFFTLIIKVGKLISDLSTNLLFFIDSLNEEQKSDELLMLSSRLSTLSLALNRYADRNHWTDDVYFIERKIRNKSETFELKIAPLSISEMMQKYVYEPLRTVICTSATLDLNDDFGYWQSRVGLPCPNKPTLKKKIESSFNYKQNLLLITASDSPDFNNKAPEAYVDYIEKITFKTILSSTGGGLVLFTSYNMMKKVYTALADKLRENNITPLIQGSMDRFRILNKFKEDENSVLFATNSFWQGIDAPGNTLRIVIIVKLPFPSPGEPILEARLEQLSKRDDNGFAKMLLPEATMRLKQGFGRLIRKNTDKGIVVILDSRIIKKNYGRYMISVLPKCYHMNTESKNISDKIENFLY